MENRLDKVRYVIYITAEGHGKQAGQGSLCYLYNSRGSWKTGWIRFVLFFFY